MEAYIDIIKDKVFVKNNGEVTEASISKKPLKADIKTELTEAEFNSIELEKARNNLVKKIIDIKQKYELFSAGICSESEWQKKVAEYQPLKDAYELLKGN